jgi:hypothetical protein
MLYTLIGNGNCNKKEVISSLSTLMEAAGGINSFGLILPEVDSASETLEAVFKWITSEAVYYESVISNDEGGMHRGFYEKADEVYTAKRPLDRAIKLAPVRKAVDEECAVLVLSDDIDNDEAVLYGISKAIDMDLPVYDIGGQMVQIMLEEEQEEEPQPLEQPSPEEFSLPHKEEDEDEDVDFSREDLESLTRNELKFLVESRGAIPRDMRSKESMIDALMDTLGSEKKIEQKDAQTDPDCAFYLLKIDADGSTEMRPLTAEQAALVS